MKGKPGSRVLVATFVSAGAVFGSLDLAMVAFAGQAGSPGAAGPLLALVALGQREVEGPQARDVCP
jgi:hypothetical protein